MKKTTAMEHANLGGSVPFAGFAGAGAMATVRIRRKYLASRGQIAEKLSALFGVKLGAELGSGPGEESGPFATFQVSCDQSGSVVDAETGDIAGSTGGGACAGPATRGVVGVVTMSGDLINQIQVSGVV